MDACTNCGCHKQRFILRLPFEVHANAREHLLRTFKEWYDASSNDPGIALVLSRDVEVITLGVPKYGIRLVGGTPHTPDEEGMRRFRLGSLASVEYKPTEG